MKRPNAPILERFPKTIEQLLDKEDYTAQELVNLVSEFADKHGCLKADVFIGWDENWTGYESCEVRLRLWTTETKPMYERRKRDYEALQAQYLSDLEEWKKYCARTNESRAAQKKQAAIDKRKQQIAKLQAEVKELET